MTNKERNFSVDKYNKTIQNEKRVKEMSLDEKMRTSSYSQRNEIASCSLEDTIFYG